MIKKAFLYLTIGGAMAIFGELVYLLSGEGTFKTDISGLIFLGGIAGMVWGIEIQYDFYKNFYYQHQEDESKCAVNTVEKK